MEVLPNDVMFQSVLEDNSMSVNENNVRVGLLARLEAKPGKEEEVEAFLRSTQSIVLGEPATIVWFAIRIGPSTFGIFDAFPDQNSRQAHLSGRVAAALKEKSSE